MQAPVIVITVVIAVVMVANLAALIWLRGRNAALQQRLAKLAHRAKRLEDRAKVITPEVERTLSPTPKRLITVELLDPIGLASSRVSLAGPVGGLAPRAIDRVVHEQTLKTLRQVLVEYGVEADVQLRKV